MILVNSPGPLDDIGADGGGLDGDGGVACGVGDGDPEFNVCKSWVKPPDDGVGAVAGEDEGINGGGSFVGAVSSFPRA